MPKRADLKSVLVIGSGPIVIGQACEFDYSGTQACRVLRQEGIRVSLVNSNPATIMTDPEFADATYVEPITLDVLEKVIAKERPDARAAHAGRPDGAQRGGRAARGGHAGPLRRRADRRRHRGDQGRRGPQPVQGDRHRARRRGAARAASATRSPSASRQRPSSATRWWCGRRSPWAAPGPASPTTRGDLRRIAGTGPGRQPGHRGAARGVDPRLEGVRARADARPQRQRRSSSARSRTSTRWACTPATRSRWPRR